MTRFLLTLAAAVCATVFLSAETIYVLAEEGCSDRIRYQRATANQARSDYYAYSFRMADGNLLSLETGAEGKDARYNLPTDYITCGNLRLAPNIAYRVWSGADQVIVLRKSTDGQYLAHPVSNASVLSKQGDKITYTSRFTRFQFNERIVALGSNISYQRPSAQVLLQGAEPGPCSPELLVQHKQAGGQYPLIDFRISREVGLLERRLGSNGVNSSGNVIQARAINGVPVSTYLSTNCERLKARIPGQSLTSSVTQPAVITRNEPITLVQPAPAAPAPVTPPTNPAIVQRPPAPSQVPYTQPGYISPSTPQAAVPVQPESRAYRDLQSGATTPQPTNQRVATTMAPAPAPAPVEKLHTVKKGETLYAISRQYDTSPADLKSLNGMAGNTIFPGQTLKVSGAPASAAPAAPAPSVYSAPTPTTQPAPNAAALQTDGKTRIVRAGETVASVALQSGYTEAKFRSINNLGPEAVLYAGQQVVVDHCICPATPTGAYGITPRQVVTAPPTTQATPPAPATYATPAPITSPTYSPNLQAQPYTAPAPTTYNYPQPPAAPAAPRTMTQLESRGATPAPSGAYGAPARSTQPSAGNGAFLGTRLRADPRPAAAPATAPTPQPINRATHTVQHGETLYAIAQRYGLTTLQLRQLNNMSDREVIAPFQKLYVQ